MEDAANRLEITEKLEKGIVYTRFGTLVTKQI